MNVTQAAKRWGVRTQLSPTSLALADIVPTSRAANGFRGGCAAGIAAVFAGCPAIFAKDGSLKPGIRQSVCAPAMEPGRGRGGVRRLHRHRQFLRRHRKRQGIFQIDVGGGGG